MNKPFDAATKHLIEMRPADWLSYIGLPVDGEISIVDADVASIHLSADKLIRVGGLKPYIAHIEFQSGPDADLDGRMLGYNVAIRRRHSLPVRSVVILLRPEAGPRSVTGRFSESDGTENWIDFGYKLVRVWEQSAEAVLTGGLGTLPLAPISKLTPMDFGGVIRRMEERLGSEDPTLAAELETAAYILMGLRYSKELIAHMMRGVRQMKESVTYQAILEEGAARGEARGERKLLIRAATKKFGPPDNATLAAISVIEDVNRVEKMFDELEFINTWHELLKI